MTPIETPKTMHTPAGQDALLRERIDAYLTAIVDGLDLDDGLREAIRYALLSPGKRIRPLLALHACIAAGGEAERAMPAAAAVEMVHAFSLTHDDLPALDDDDLRRGRPTVHVQFCEAMAVLAGDALLALPFRVLTERAGAPETAAALVDELSRATMSMISGQVRDTLPGASADVPEERRLELIHREKTGALIVAAARMGVVSAGPSAADLLEPATRYAGAVGLLFQIVDDLLDVEQATEHLGKRSSKDAEAGKLTYPGVMGIEASRRRVEALLGEATRALEADWPGPIGPLRALAEFASHRTR